MNDKIATTIYFNLGFSNERKMSSYSFYTIISDQFKVFIYGDFKFKSLFSEAENNEQGVYRLSLY